MEFESATRIVVAIRRYGMGSSYDTAVADVIYTIILTLSGNVEDYFFHGRGGGDRIYEGFKNDFLHGEANNYQLYVGGGTDKLIGDSGNDRLDGGTGDDFLFEQTGNGTLIGGTGNDRCKDTLGNDTYIYKPDDDYDIINDNKTATGSVGDSGTDTLQFDYLSTETSLFEDGTTNNLYEATAADMADDTMHAGVVIKGFFLATNNDIEYIKLLDKTLFL